MTHITCKEAIVDDLRIPLEKLERRQRREVDLERALLVALALWAVVLAALVALVAGCGDVPAPPPAVVVVPPPPAASDLPGGGCVCPPPPAPGAK